MAKLGVNFRVLTENGYKSLDRVELIGSKMTKAWMRKNYGKHAEDIINDEMYYVKKPNKYGILWIIKSGRTHTWSISTWPTHSQNGKAEKTPSYDTAICKLS